MLAPLFILYDNHKVDFVSQKTDHNRKTFILAVIYNNNFSLFEESILKLQSYLSKQARNIIKNYDGNSNRFYLS